MYFMIQKILSSACPPLTGEGLVFRGLDFTKGAARNKQHSKGTLESIRNIYRRNRCSAGWA